MPGMKTKIVGNDPSVLKNGDRLDCAHDGTDYNCTVLEYEGNYVQGTSTWNEKRTPVGNVGPYSSIKFNFSELGQFPGGFPDWKKAGFSRLEGSFTIKLDERGHIIIEPWKRIRCSTTTVAGKSPELECKHY